MHRHFLRKRNDILFGSDEPKKATPPTFLHVSPVGTETEITINNQNALIL